MSHSQETHAVSLRAISHIYAGGTPDKKATRYWENGSIPWVNSGTVNQGLVTRPSAFISEEAFGNSSTSWARKGDLIVALAGQGQTKGKVAQMGMDACVNQSMAVIHIRETSNFVPRFAYYAIHSQYRDIRFMAGGDKRDGLNLQHIGAIRIPYPPLETQQRIADYLDRETAEIDAAVADLDRYVELLEKRRRAKITFAVEGKSNLVKDNSTESHPVANLGLVAHAYQPETLSMEALNQSGTFPVFGANGIIGRHDNFNHEQPQVVIACRGNTCGAVNWTLPKSWINGNAMVINPHAEKLRKDFLFYVLEIADYSLVITGSAQPQIIRESLYRLRVPLPPLETQRRIADYLDRETTEIDSLIADSTRLRDLLLKRRSVLITEVVTGRKQV